MAITFTNLGSSADPDFDDGANATSYASASWTPPTAGIIALWVQSRRNGGPDTPTVSGNSLTWTQIGSTFDCDGGGNGLSLFLADASGSSTGATTVDYSTNTQVHCTALFLQVEGVDISGGLAAAVVQQPTASGTATSGSVTFAAAGNIANRMICVHWHKVDEAVTGDANWTDQDGFNNVGQTRGTLSQYRTDATDTACDASWSTSGDWAGMGAELKASIAGGGLVIPGINHPTKNLLLRI